MKTVKTIISQQTGLISIRALAAARNILPPISLNQLLASLSNLGKLQFRLLGFVEEDSTDSFLQGANDEVFMSALGTDSSAIHIDHDGKLVVDQTEALVIGDVSDDSVRNPWKQNPYVLLEFDLNHKGYWPRTYVVTLLIVEQDNQDVADTFNDLKRAVGDTVRAGIITAATTGGAAVGTAILPGIGTAVGAAAGFLAGLAWDEVIPAIGEGLANEIFSPRVLTVQLPYGVDSVPPPQRGPQSFRVEEHGAIYEILYEWYIAK